MVKVSIVRDLQPSACARPTRNFAVAGLVEKPLHLQGHPGRVPTNQLSKSVIESQVIKLLVCKSPAVYATRSCLLLGSHGGLSEQVKKAGAGIPEVKSFSAMSLITKSPKVMATEIVRSVAKSTGFDNQACIAQRHVVGIYHLRCLPQSPSSGPYTHLVQDCLVQHHFSASQEILISSSSSVRSTARPSTASSLVAAGQSS